MVISEAYRAYWEHRWREMRRRLRANLPTHYDIGKCDKCSHDLVHHFHVKHKETQLNNAIARYKDGTYCFICKMQRGGNCRPLAQHTKLTYPEDDL